METIRDYLKATCVFMLGMSVGVDGLWRRCCGSCAAVGSGGCYPRRMGAGIACTSAFHAGVRGACGTDYWIIWRCADLQHVLMDSTVGQSAWRVRPGQKNSTKEHALGCSRGGFSTKIHALTDVLGVHSGSCSRADRNQILVKRRIFLLESTPGRGLADKGYDADALLDILKETYIETIIPPTANRTVQRLYGEHLYKERHMIECFFGKMKHYRRIFSRYEKLAINYLSMLSFVGTLVWLR